jgi:anti-sigma regulatory factor (Ser/Thr protein kinase)
MQSDDQGHDFDLDKLVLKLNVKLAADRKAVDHVVHAIMEVVRKMDCASGAEDAIELALTEALANAIVHGAQSDPSKSIECDVACDQHRDLLIVRHRLRSVRHPQPGSRRKHLFRSWPRHFSHQSTHG